MVKPYISGMKVKFEDVVRSAKTGLPFIRKNNTPATLTITSDPADLYSDFIVDDPSTYIGSVQSFPDSLNVTSSVMLRNGQAWLRTGNYLPLTNATLTKPIPAYLRVYYDYWTGVYTPAQVGMSGTLIVDVVGDGKGNWMAVNSAGTLFKSATDAVSWATIPGITTTANAKLACNGNGRWWLCNNTGQVYVSDDFGASWSMQQAAGNTYASVFSYMNGKLWYAPATTYTISASSGQLSFVGSLPDTNSTTQTWSGNFYNLSSAYPTFPYNTTGMIRVAACDNKSTIWFMGTASNGYLSIFALNTQTGVFSINTMGAADSIQGLCYDDQSDMCWAYVSAGDTNTSYNYELCLNTSGSIIASYTNSIINTGLYNWSNAESRMCGVGSGYLRKGGSAAVFMRTITNTTAMMFKFSGVTMSVGRNPTVNGNLWNYQFSGMKQAGDTTVAYGNFMSRGVGVVGLPTASSNVAGKIDWIRVV